MMYYKQGIAFGDYNSDCWLYLAFSFIQFLTGLMGGFTDESKADILKDLIIHSLAEGNIREAYHYACAYADETCRSWCDIQVEFGL